MDSAIDSIVRRSLTEFADRVNKTQWEGREHEAVSLYAIGYLASHCRPATVFHDLRQIGIDVAVPQLDRPRGKEFVCKDLVIWPEPEMTVWHPKRNTRNEPLAILEFKTNQEVVSVVDTKWLCDFSKGRDQFVGYAVCLDPKRRHFLLSCTRVKKQTPQEGWLLIEKTLVIGRVRLLEK